MDDTLTSEEYEEEEGDAGTSGVLTLDGEAWKNRDNTTYNSLLDINGITDLFSQESANQYNDRKQESYTEQQERRRLFHMFRHGGDIKEHTGDAGNGVYMTGVSVLDVNSTISIGSDADGSIVEFIGSPNRVDENNPNSKIDNGSMSEYHVELIIVYDNVAEVN